MPDYSALIKSVNPKYFPKFLRFNNFEIEEVGNICKVQGFEQYNYLVDLNCIFSNRPTFYPIDRTQTTLTPVKWAVDRPWQPPNKSIKIEDAFLSRVRQFEQLDKKINIFWSGGIDSTAIVTAFLKNSTHLDQIRIIYSPWSYYEHPEYIDFLKKFPMVELFDQSGELYLDLQLDGIYISGNGSDEIHASIDKSFLETYGYDILKTPWKDFFLSRNNNKKFIEFCEHFFEHSGFKIINVLEARWWFYTSCKIDSILREDTIPFLLSNKQNNFNITDVYSFYDCIDYESFVYWNINSIMPRNDYKTWKQCLKDYCYNFDGLSNWHLNKSKFHSVQISDYGQKKVSLNDQRYLLILDDSTKISTPSLPFFSKKELKDTYGNSLDYLINQPEKS